MAKSIRSKIKRTHRAARRSEFAPTRDARQESRGVRMTAYVARSEARRLAAEGKHISDDLAAASAQADLLDLADDQMIEKTARGHHFFLPPQSKLNVTGPVIPDLAALPVFVGRNSITSLTPEEEREACRTMDDNVFGSTAALEARKAKLAERERDRRDEAVKNAIARRKAVEAAANSSKGSFKVGKHLMHRKHSSK